MLQTFADILTFEGEERLPMITMMIGMVKMWWKPMMMMVRDEIIVIDDDDDIES